MAFLTKIEVDNKHLYNLKVFSAGKPLSYTFEVTPPKNVSGEFLFILDYSSALLPIPLIHKGIFKKMTYGEAFHLMIEIIVKYFRAIGLIKDLSAADIMSEIKSENYEKLCDKPLKTIWEIKTPMTAYETVAKVRVKQK